MPGPALHHMIADRLRVRIAASNGLGPTLPASDYAQLDALLGDPANVPYLYLGCQGPDFLFFNTNDVSPTVKSLVEAYFDVYDFIENFKRDLKDLVPQPVLDALAAFDEAANAVVTSSSTLTELGELFSDMQQVVDGLMATLLEAVKAWVSEFNLFDLVSHPYRDGVPKGPKPAGFSVPVARADATNEWWWFDAMHYRKTGKLAKKLLEKTTPGSPLHLYAIGYLTHVSADTVGHPYVNAISGGPYRSFAQRHKASENYQDTFNFLDVRGVDWNRSAIHALYNFNFAGTIDTENDEPDPFTNLPPALAALITDALNEIYDEDGAPPTPDYAKPITTSDIDDTYRLWYRWFKSATDTGTLPAPVPYSLTAELREVWDQVVDNLDSIGDFIEDAADAAGRPRDLGDLPPPRRPHPRGDRCGRSAHRRRPRRAYDARLRHDSIRGMPDLRAPLQRLRDVPPCSRDERARVPDARAPRRSADEPLREPGAPGREREHGPMDQGPPAGAALRGRRSDPQRAPPRLSTHERRASGRLRGARELPRQDVHLVRVG